MFHRTPATPAVSVVMPIFNQARYCRAAIESVRGQSLRDLELILIDDGSTDETATIVDSLARRDKRIRVVHRRHAGVSASCNLGILLARCEFIARLDGDDLCVEDRLETQLAFLEDHPSVAVLGGDMMAMAQDGRPVRRVTYEPDSAALHLDVMHGNPLAHPTVMMRRSTVMKVGGYRRVFDYAEDYDLWLRASEHADLANLPKILVHYRMHGESTTSRHFMRQALHAEVARLAAQRRRAGKSDPFNYLTVVDQSALDLIDLDAGEREQMTAMLEDALREDRAHAAQEQARQGRGVVSRPVA